MIDRNALNYLNRTFCIFYQLLTCIDHQHHICQTSQESCKSCTPNIIYGSELLGPTSRKGGFWRRGIRTSKRNVDWDINFSNMAFENL